MRDQAQRARALSERRNHTTAIVACSLFGQPHVVVLVEVADP